MTAVVDVVQLEGVAVVRCRGELDLAVAPIMSRTLSEFADSSAPVAQGGPVAVVVDLTEATFLDCSALGVLVQLSRRCALHGRVFVFCGPTGVVRRFFTVLELQRQFLVVATLEEAVHGAVPSPNQPDAGVGLRNGSG